MSASSRAVASTGGPRTVDDQRTDLSAMGISRLHSSFSLRPPEPQTIITPIIIILGHQQHLRQARHTETGYVTDSCRHPDPTRHVRRYKILNMAPSGTPLQILKPTAPEGSPRSRLRKGPSGWTDPPI